MKITKTEKLFKYLLENGWLKVEANTHGNRKAYFHKEGARIDINGAATYSIYKCNVIICEDCFIDIINGLLKISKFISYKNVEVLK
jgi:hypothetical protein